MFTANLLKHVCNKIYFNRDLPKDRNEPCELDIGEVLFEFFIPTTKRKKSVSQWLGSYTEINSINDLDIKAIFLIIADVLLSIPRFALNIIKLVTEVLPLMLRELSYAVFESMVKGSNETEVISKRLYQAAAGVFWFFTSLSSLIYLIGGLITSPGMTIISMMDTLEQLKVPTLPSIAILGFFCLAVFAFHLTMIVILAPIILPISVVMTPPVALVIEGSIWIGIAIEVALVFFGLSGHV
jgi:hypothetical protein